VNHKYPAHQVATLRRADLRAQKNGDPRRIKRVAHAILTYERAQGIYTPLRRIAARIRFLHTLY